MEKHRIIGVFQNEQDAINAINSLKDKGFKADDISVVAKNEEDQERVDLEAGTHTTKGAVTGAAAGAAFGGVGGLLLGLGALAIPGAGPFIALGQIGAVLAGMAAGAAGGGIIGGLVTLGVPESDAKEYESYINRGEVLVLVEADGAHRDLANETFEAYNASNQKAYAYSVAQDGDDAVGSIEPDTQFDVNDTDMAGSVVETWDKQQGTR